MTVRFGVRNPAHWAKFFQNKTWLSSHSLWMSFVVTVLKYKHPCMMFKYKVYKINHILEKCYCIISKWIFHCFLDFPRNIDRDTLFWLYLVADPGQRNTKLPHLIGETGVWNIYWSLDICDTRWQKNYCIS